MEPIKCHCEDTMLGIIRRKDPKCLNQLLINFVYAFKQYDFKEVY